MVIISTLLYFALDTPNSDGAPLDHGLARSTATPVQESKTAPIRCDDGSSPRDAAGKPNWDCYIEGCSSNDLICWEERLDHCFDESSTEAQCVFTTSTCSSKIRCFDLWLGCSGKWECMDTESWIGCDSGKCTTGQPAPPPHVDEKQPPRASDEPRSGRDFKRVPSTASTPARKRTRTGGRAHRT